MGRFDKRDKDDREAWMIRGRKSQILFSILLFSGLMWLGWAVSVVIGMIIDWNI